MPYKIDKPHPVTPVLVADSSLPGFTGITFQDFACGSRRHTKNAYLAPFQSSSHADREQRQDAVLDFMPCLVSATSRVPVPWSACG